MAKGKWIMIYCVNYGQFFDDEKFFLNYKDAALCMAADRLKQGLTEEDQLLGIKTVKVWKQYIPKKYGHETTKGSE
jgi:hypothetical protein